MVLREVGEDGAREIHVVDAPERQGVARGFHSHVAHAGVAHGRQKALNIGGVGRGVGRCFAVTRPAVIDGPDHPDGFSRGLQHGLQQVRDGRFAVGAGDPDDLEMLRRAAVKTGGERRQGFRR